MLNPTHSLLLHNLFVLLLAVVLFVHVCSLSSLVVLIFETPVSCTFAINYARPITEFAERRTCFEKALIYIVYVRKSKFHFYRTSICEDGLGSRNSVHLSVCPSVRLSVTRVDCDKTK